MTNKVFSTLLLLIGLISFGNGLDCTENYSPCTCSGNSIEVPGSWIYCENVNSIAEVVDVFQRTSTVNLNGLVLNIPSPEENFIPAEIITDKRFKFHLFITCPYGTNTELIIDPEAFSSTRETMMEIRIHNCNLSKLDLAFLNGFDNLSYMTLNGSTDLGQAMATLPPINQLTYIYLTYSSGFADWNTFNPLTNANGLQSLRIYGNSDLDDAVMDKILNWIMEYSVTTISTFSLYSNQLTKVPDQIPLFTGVYQLSLGDNRIKTITNGSLTFKTVSYLDISYMELETIEAGAFQGRYNQATVYLDGNLLTRFEASVFQDILQQMASNMNPIGSVTLSDNPIDCDSDPCHLAWLVRDNRRLLTFVKNGKCTNGLLFNQLDVTNFNDCPISTL